MPHDLPALNNEFTLRYGAPVGPMAAGNDVIASLLSHRSIRGYLGDALPEGTVELLVAAAQSAATSSNMQLWSVIAVEDPATLAKLAELSNGQKHIAQAPLNLVWLVDLSRAERIGEAHGHEFPVLPYTETFMVGVIDAALAAQNAVVAAESLGLGTVYIGAMRNHPQAVAELLGLPPQVMAVFGLCVGTPDPALKTQVRPRLPQSVVLHRERYSTAGEAEGIASYEQRFADYQKAEGLPTSGWLSRVFDRLGTLRSMSGRDKMRTALAALGFKLD